jgi:hypothetical protein
MLGLIIVAGMVPGLLIGLRRTTAIDYDAVAYRTAAILAEDPGWPVFPPWENSNNADGVDRIGLAVAKESPNILSTAKIEKFFDSGLFTYPDDYRQKLIFGDYPYRFNITLNTTEGINSTGDPLPGLTGYGYIRRIVKIKEFSSSSLDLNSSINIKNQLEISNVDEIPGNFTIRLNLSELLDKSINPAYQYDPRIEPIVINITNFSATLNNTFFNNNTLAANDSTWNATIEGYTAPDNATLDRIRFYKNENPSALPFDYNVLNNDSYILQIADQNGDFSEYSNLTPGKRVFNDTILTIFPGYLPIDEGTTLDITFFFKDYNNTMVEPPHTLIDGIHSLNYTSNSLNRKPLRTGWLEVAVW